MAGENSFAQPAASLIPERLPLPERIEKTKDSELLVRRNFMSGRAHERPILRDKIFFYNWPITTFGIGKKFIPHFLPRFISKTRTLVHTSGAIRKPRGLASRRDFGQTLSDSRCRRDYVTGVFRLWANWRDATFPPRLQERPMPLVKSRFPKG
jgi:hypothetical protein